VTPPRRNVEIKARDADPGRTLERALALGAADEGVLTQRDTYFGGARGRLKLREQEPGGAQLIAYSRPDSEQARASAYRLADVSDPAALREALDAALGTRVVVDKRRHLLLWESVRIHLDEVEGLGAFVELEGVAPPESDLTREHEHVAHLRDELGIDDPIPVSYSDMIEPDTPSPEELLAAAEAVMRNAYAPYSNFPVGAALSTPSGAVFTGANVENAAYPQGQCAEASAIGAMVAGGESRITAVAVVAERLDICPPCGGCRQRLKEFAAPDTPVYLGRPGGPVQTTTVGELLPLAFDEGSLG
jgi:homotetrameric cytidine deaminase